jgi:hypothetical protein
MSSMLERLGIPKGEKTHDAPWRDKVVTKDVFGTSQEAIEKGYEILDRGVKLEKVKKDIKKMGIDNDAKDLISKYQSMTDVQKAKFRQNLLPIVQQKYPELLTKFVQNGIRV